MTRYEYGFLQACQQRGVDGRPILMKMAQDAGQQPSADAVPKTPNWAQRKITELGDKGRSALNDVKSFSKENPAGAGAIGGGLAGALAMLIYEAARRKNDGENRKDFLKSILIGLNGGAMVGAAGGHWGPGLYDKARPYADRTGDYFKNLGRAIAGKK